MDDPVSDDIAAPTPPSPNRTTWLFFAYGWSVTCCIVLPALPLVIEREDEFSKWHAKHGLVMGLGWLVGTLVLLLPANLFGAFDLVVLKVVLYFLWFLLWLAVVGVTGLSLVRALDGQRWALKPVETLLERLEFD